MKSRDRGFAEAHRGAHVRIPMAFKYIVKFVSPAYLLIIFALWFLFNVLGWNMETGEFIPTGYVADLIGTDGKEPSTVARLSVLLVGIVLTFTIILIATAAPRWKAMLASAEKEVN